MRVTPVLPIAVAVGMLLLSVVPAGAQIFEVVGTRAQGMGGAFVAVANDATATWWNPAGLATGSFLGSTLERGSTTAPRESGPNGPAWRGDTNALAVVVPSLGLSYYRLRVSEVVPGSSTGDAAADRQDQEAAAVGVRSWLVRQFGVSAGQSIGNYLVIASTLKLAWGGQVVASGPTTDDPLDAAADLDVPTEFEGDLDIGAMSSFGRTRLGLVVKNVSEPEFDNGGNRLVLRRQVRAGIAFMPGGNLTMAFDADLTRTATVLGDVRHIAGGAEMWLLQRRVGLRGGVSANTLGEARPSASAGLSLAPRPGFFIDGALTIGPDRSREGWNVGFRVGY